MIFGKLSLGGYLLVQLCIFSCKDKAMLGYNMLVMYLRTIGIFLLALKKYLKKYHIRRSTFQCGGGVMKSVPLVHFFFFFFLTLP